MPLKSDVEALYQVKQQALESGLESMGLPVAGIPSAMARDRAMDVTIADLMEQRIKLKHENWLQKQKELRNLARLMGFEKLAQSLGSIGGNLVALYQQYKTTRKGYGIKPEEKQTAQGFWNWLQYEQSVLDRPEGWGVDEETAKQLWEFANKSLPFGPEGVSPK